MLALRKGLRCELMRCCEDGFLRGCRAGIQLLIFMDSVPLVVQM